MQERYLPDVYVRWADGFNIIAEELALLSTTEVSNSVTKLIVESVGEIQANTTDYVHTAPEILAFISRYITLFPGDMIALGQIGALLDLPKNPSNLSGYAEIEGVACVEFTFS